MMIYKILTKDQWSHFQSTGIFAGAPIDLRDGYIHFSAATQVAATAEKHFAGQHGLIVLSIGEEPFRDLLRWEVSRDGKEFPHLYGRIGIEDVVTACPLEEWIAGNSKAKNPLPGSTSPIEPQGDSTL